jgi:hypothetical protein
MLSGSSSRSAEFIEILSTNLQRTRTAQVF